MTFSYRNPNLRGRELTYVVHEADGVAWSVHYDGEVLTRKGRRPDNHGFGGISLLDEVGDLPGVLFGDVPPRRLGVHHLAARPVDLPGDGELRRPETFHDDVVSVADFQLDGLALAFHKGVT